MIKFLQRRWFWFQVAMGWRKAPPPITPTIIARMAIDQLDRNLLVSAFIRSPATHLVVTGDEAVFLKPGSAP